MGVGRLDDAPFDVPFGPPTPDLVRRTVRGADLDAANGRSVAMRRRMRAKGMRLVALSSRDTPDGATIELVFAPPPGR